MSTPTKSTAPASAPKEKKAATKSAGPMHPKWIDMIKECIAANKEDARIGVSRNTIKKFAETTYKIEMGAAQNTHLAKAITRGAEQGVLALPKGISGRVKLAPKPSKDQSAAKENQPTVPKVSKSKTTASKPLAAKKATAATKPATKKVAAAGKASDKAVKPATKPKTAAEPKKSAAAPKKAVASKAASTKKTSSAANKAKKTAATKAASKRKAWVKVATPAPKAAPSRRVWVKA